MSTALIKSTRVRELVEAGAVQRAVVSALPSGRFMVRVIGRGVERILATHRNTVREYHHLNTMAAHLVDVGIKKVELDLGGFAPNRNTQFSMGKKKSEPELALSES